jgi:hypothetical protein
MATEKRIPFAPSKIETIDASLLNFVKNLNLHATTNKGRAPVPITWVSPERSFKSKAGQEIRYIR